MRKLLLLCLCGSLVVSTGYGQGKGNKNGHHKGHSTHRTTVTHTRVKHKNGHHVKVKPNRPRYTRPAAPGRDYVYVEEDWNWNPGTNSWVWYGNRWVPIVRPQAVWVPGVWVSSSYGWVWQPGRWR